MSKLYVLTDHVKQRIAERDIKIEWVEKAVFNPDRLEISKKAPDSQLEALAIIPEFGNRVLRVIYDHTGAIPVIITVYFDRKMKGKL